MESTIRTKMSLPYTREMDGGHMADGSLSEGVILDCECPPILGITYSVRLSPIKA